MTAPAKYLLDKSALKETCAAFSIEQIQSMKTALHELIDERKQAEGQAILQRKGERALADMHGLMAKAGISMEEFQAALSD